MGAMVVAWVASFVLAAWLVGRMTRTEHRRHYPRNRE